MKRATVSLYLDTRRIKKNNLYPLKARVHYERKYQYYPLNLDTTVEQYEDIIKNTVRHKDVYDELFKIQAAIDSLEVFTFNLLENALNKYVATDKVKDWFEAKISELKENDQISTAETYTNALIAINKVGKDLRLIDIDEKFLKLFYNKLVYADKSIINVTTAGMYMRNLRHILNLAIDAGALDVKHYPFKKFTIPAGRKRKYNNATVKHSDLLKIINYKSEGKTRLARLKQQYVDYFAFSYYLGGCNFTDLLKLKPDCFVSDGDNINIEFTRQKTKRTSKQSSTIVHRVNNHMVEIMKRQCKPDTKYLFPILNGKEKEAARKEVQIFIKQTNKFIKKIAKELDIKNAESISTYSARHSYATHLFNSGFSTEQVAGLLGHEDTKTTENYRGRLSNVILDKVSLILNQVI